MLLVSYEFAAFFILLLTVYYLVPGRLQWLLLLAASYWFYVSGGLLYVCYPLFTTVSTWLIARKIGRITRQAKAAIRDQQMDREQKREYNKTVKKRQCRWMQLGLVLNFGILAVLKYTGFVLESLSGLFHLVGAEGRLPSVGWLLPLGISYYTFQSMGYLIDVYHRKYEPEENLAKFALFVSFFPQVIAGPISRFDQLRESLFAAHRFQWKQVRDGAERMLWGYFKKLVVADRLAPAVLAITSSPETYDGIYVLLGMVGYTVWMYADFAGGIDIVLGAAQMFDIRLPENFDRPFFSRSLGEFWRRWHMTLMLWLREYIFFPVSGSRFAKKISGVVRGLFGKEAGTKAPVYVGSIVVWLTAGIWHGASWNFVAWGMANCVVMLISQELSGCYRSFHKRFEFSNHARYRYFEMIRTFLLFCCLEMFEYYSFGNVFVMFWNMITGARIGQLFDGRLAGLGLSSADWMMVLLGVLLMFVISVLQGRGSVRRQLAQQPAVMQYAAVFGLFLVVLVAGVYGQGYDASQFIYNQF